jgi:hypothetical protein
MFWVYEICTLALNMLVLLLIKNSNCIAEFGARSGNIPNL